MTSVGMNLTLLAYWTTEHPFLDRFKTAGDWGATASNFAPVNAPVPMDANGYPIGLPPGASYLSTLFAVDPPELGMTDRYVLTYDGTATIQMIAGRVISAEPGKIVFEAQSTMPGILVTSMSASDPLHDIHVVREDQVDLFNRGEIFNPAFLAKIDDFTVLRFMDWANINNSLLTSWDQRTTPDSATWQGPGSNTRSVPIEVMVALANKTGASMWFNVPTQADDNYVRQALSYIRDHLNPGIKLHIEYSNEMWNWGFYQTRWAQQQANNMWGTDKDGNGTVDMDNPAENVGSGHLLWYGYRSAQIAAISQEVFGVQAAARVDNVVATQTVYLGLETAIFDGITRANVGSAKDLFEEYAVTTYFGDQVAGMSDNDRVKIMQWARGGEAGLAAAFHELEYGGSLENNYSLAYFANVWAYQKTVADKYGLDLVAYEGGMSGDGRGIAPADQPDFMAFWSNLQRDPRMGDLYSKMVAMFGAAGGSELTAYADAQPLNIGGSFGTLEDIYGGSAKYDALLAANNTLNGGTDNDHLTGHGGNDIYIVEDVGDVVTELDGGGIDEVRTSLASYMLGTGVENLIATGTGPFSGTGNALDNILTGSATAANSLSGGLGNDVLTGGSAADVLDGGQGADRMVGGAGDDIYIVDDVNDATVELVGGGTDEIRTALTTFTLGANLENLTYTGTAAFTGTGNELANTISGGAGNDTLDGGAGPDTMIGGTGDDIYIVDSLRDRVIENAGGGTDTIRTSLSRYTLAANVENLTFTGAGPVTATGNDAANTILGSITGKNTLFGGRGEDMLTGGGSADILDGGPGADRMIGGGGDDTYFADNSYDLIFEETNGGIDEVRTTANYFGLAPEIENITFVGTGDFIARGNASANVMTGGIGNDALQGNGGDDLLVGDRGNDQLEGGGGVDRMIGGFGNDTYFVDDSGDVVIENAGEGSDTVITWASYSLALNVETLILADALAIDARGNELANRIIGSNGNNKISGLGGDDWIDGGDGDDQIDGGAGNDRLGGGSGNDILIGGAGSDSLTGGAGADRFVFNQGDLANTAGLTDTIGEFSRADGDKIDLSALRPNVASALNFLGARAFTHHAGEVRSVAAGNQTDVMIDLNGDGIADLHLMVVTSSGKLLSSDFLL